MLSKELVAEIRRLLSESDLSYRDVAAKVGVSRGTVMNVAHRRGAYRDDYERNPPDAYRRHGVPSRCRGCGGLVYPPCLLCKARSFHHQLLIARLLVKDKTRDPNTPRRVA